MKPRLVALAKTMDCPHNGGWLVPLLLTVLLLGAGCATIADVFEGEKPEAEIVVQSPAGYGIITNVGAASMADREIRKGDLALTVDLDDGQVIVVIQAEDAIYTVGDRVRVIRDGKGFVRVQLL